MVGFWFGLVLSHLFSLHLIHCPHQIYIDRYFISFHLRLPFVLWFWFYSRCWSALYLRKKETKMNPGDSWGFLYCADGWVLMLLLMCLEEVDRWCDKAFVFVFVLQGDISLGWRIRSLAGRWLNILFIWLETLMSIFVCLLTNIYMLGGGNHVNMCVWVFKVQFHIGTKGCERLLAHLSLQLQTTSQGTLYVSFTACIVVLYVDFQGNIRWCLQDNWSPGN